MSPRLLLPSLVALLLLWPTVAVAAGPAGEATEGEAGAAPHEFTWNARPTGDLALELTFTLPQATRCESRVFVAQENHGPGVDVVVVRTGGGDGFGYGVAGGDLHANAGLAGTRDVARVPHHVVSGFGGSGHHPAGDHTILLFAPKLAPHDNEHTGGDSIQIRFACDDVFALSSVKASREVVVLDAASLQGSVGAGVPGVAQVHAMGAQAMVFESPEVKAYSAARGAEGRVTLSWPGGGHTWHLPESFHHAAGPGYWSLEMRTHQQGFLGTFWVALAGLAPLEGGLASLEGDAQGTAG